MLRDISLPAGIVLRMAQAEDRVFMEELFRSTREYFYQMPLPRQHIDVLISQQYQSQQASYARQWPTAYTLIVECSAAAVGKITLDETETALHILDFILAPAMRGKGHGAAILRAMQVVAGKRGMPVKLSVDRENLPARTLYLRLGFQLAGMSDTHESMIWSSSGPDFPGVTPPGSIRMLSTDASG